MGDRKRANERLRELMRAHYVETDARTAADLGDSPTSCSKGCSACCRQLIVGTLAEAAYIVAKYPDLVRAALPRLREQDAALDRMCADLKARGVADPVATQEGTHALCDSWWDAGERCAFLRDDLCTIYDARPRACRTYFVQSEPALCGAERGTAVSVVDPGSRARGDLEGFEICARAYGELVIGPLPALLIVAWQRKGDASNG